MRSSDPPEPGSLTPCSPSIRAALTKLTAPVLLYAGEVDPMVTPAAVREAAPVFNDPTVIVQPGAVHFPWIDGTAAFATNVGSFLTGGSRGAGGSR
jgi:proline iminopeptidase